MILHRTLPERRSRKAMTFIEMVVALGISWIILAVVGGMLLYGVRSFAALSNYLEMNQKSRLALDTISSDVRHATHLISYDPGRELVFNHAVLVDPDLDPVEGTLTYRYVNGQATVDGKVYENPVLRLYTTNGVDISTKVLLTGCDEFAFTLYRRNPNAGPTPTNFETTDPALAKLIELKWRCLRKMINLDNTESVQTARVVLRN